MSITNRLSLFFLAALALVVIGFSMTLFLLASIYLNKQRDHRLETALQTLIAAIEVHPGDVEWEPLERRVTLGEDPALDQVRWVLHDPAGKLIDYSENLDDRTKLAEVFDESQSQILVRRIRAGSFIAESLSDNGGTERGVLSDTFAARQRPGSVSLPKDRTFHGDSLTLTVAVSELPVTETLYWFGWALAATSFFIWVVSAALGRWLCRRALHPVITMAASARLLRSNPTTAKALEVALSGDELEDLGLAFNDLLAGIQSALEKQQRFTGDASHQLRTPLTAMLGQVEVALRHDRSPEEYQRVLKLVQRRATQLRQITEVLLLLARSDSTSRELDWENVDLLTWFAARQDAWRDHPRAADLRWKLPDASPIVVSCHAALLGQIVDNLIDNACKYSKAGSPISISLASAETMWSVSVKDAGCGIASDDMPRVFEPFYRGGQARWLGTPGEGLGLTVVQRLAELLEGRVEVVSELERGSSFTVVFAKSMAIGIDVSNRHGGKLRRVGDPGGLGALPEEDRTCRAGGLN